MSEKALVERTNETLYRIFLTLMVGLVFVNIGGSLDRTLAKDAFGFTMIIAAASIWLLGRQTKVWGDRQLVWVGAFLALAAVSAIFSSAPMLSLIGAYRHWEGVATYFILALTYLLALQVSWDDRKISAIILTIVSLAAFASIVATAQFGYKFLSGGYLMSADKVHGFMIGPNAFSFFLMMAWPLALRRLSAPAGKWYEKPAFALASLVIFAANILTFSRTGLVVSVLMLLAVLALSKNRKRLLFLIVALIAVAWLAANLTKGLEEHSVNLQTRFNSIFSGSSFSSRIDLWKAGAKISLADPLTGSGPDTYQLAAPRYESMTVAKFPNKPKSPHNFFVNIGATLGWPALLVILVLFGRALYFGLRSKDDQRVTLALSMAGAILSSLTLEWPVFLMFPFWVFLGIVDTGKRPLEKVQPSIRPALAVVTVALLVWVGVIAGSDYYFQTGRRSKDRSLKVAALHRAISINPYVWSYWQAYYKTTTDQPFEARLALLERSRGYHPLREEPLIAEAVLRRKRGDEPAIVLALLNRAIKISPFSSTAHYIRGQVFFSQEKHGEAWADFDLVLHLWPAEGKYLKARARVQEMADAPYKK